MSDEMTPREVAARRLLGLRALETLIAEEVKKARADALAVFTRAKQQEVAELPDGTPLGVVRADKGSEAGWKVTDAGRLRAWVEANVPGGIIEQVTTVVDPALIEDLLGAVGEDSTNQYAVHPTTGELIDIPPGITFVPAGKPKLNVTGTKEAPEAVRALLGAQGAILGLREVQA